MAGPVYTTAMRPDRLTIDPRGIVPGEVNEAIWDGRRVRVVLHPDGTLDLMASGPSLRPSLRLPVLLAWAILPVALWSVVIASALSTCR